MAEEKKPEKKEVPSGPSLDTTEILIFWFIIFVLVSSGLGVIFNGGGSMVFFDSIFSKIGSFFSNIKPFLKFLSLIVSVLLVAGIIAVTRALKKVNEGQNAIFSPPVARSGEVKPLGQRNIRWDSVIEHMKSDSPSDWKLAIIEADIILDDLLTAMGYHGETMSDKLKVVEKSDFQTIDLAWEGHKIRNSIAHEGAGFLITEREARRVIDLYRLIFEEFKFI